MPTAVPVEVDAASLLELARGANLYSGRYAFVRELLQNAADATLLRLFCERGAEAFPTHERSLADLRRALDVHPIDVSIEPLGGRKAPVRLRIRDRGTGIARADLEFIGRLGASFRNPQRRARIEAMPEWMRPSGMFGIGLHSAFLVAEELRLRTTHFESGETLALRLFRHADGVSIEVEPGGAPLEPPGTEVSVEVAPHDRERDGPIFREGPGFEGDVLLDRPPRPEVDDATRLVRATAEGSIVPVRVDGEEVARAFDGAGAVFDPASGLELVWLDDPSIYQRTWSVRPYVGARSTYRSFLYYRGAALAPERSGDFSSPCLVNLHFGSARDMLTMSRDHLSWRGGGRLRAALAAALPRVGRRWLDARDAVAAPSPMRPWLARWLWLEGADVGDAWRDAEVTQAIDGRRITLGQIADSDVVELHGGVDADGRSFARVPSASMELDASAWGVANEDLVRLFPDLRSEAAEPYVIHRHGMEMRSAGVVCRFARDGRRGCADGAFRWELGRMDVGPRPTPLCHDDYRDLALDEAALDRVLDLEVDPTSPPSRDEHMLSPFVVRERVATVPGIERWVRVTAECARGGPRPVEEVARRGWDFLVDFDPDVRAREVEAHYVLDDVRGELEAAFGITLPSVDEVRATLAARRAAR